MQSTYNMAETIQNKTFKIFSFYNSKVHTLTPKYQKAVFNYFGFDIHYIVNEQFSHGDFLNYVCRNITDADYIIVFDVDCIPLTKSWINKLLADLEPADSITGAAQTANHLREGKNLYIAPFFFGISTAYLKKLNYPDMRLTPDMDAGQNLTQVIQKHGGHIVYWWPTHIEDERWPLYHPEHTMFGMGTTYNDAVYHEFYSSINLSPRFIAKCKSILPWYTKLYLKVTNRRQLKQKN